MGMAQINPAISHITPTTTLCYFLLLLLSTTPILAITNITALLSSFPDFSSFTSLLASTPSITSDLSNRSALTLLVIPNSYLSSSLDLTRRLSPSSRTDLLRYHILLQYLSSSDLHHLPPAGALITTLFQTTGRASANFGSVNITRNPVTNAITISSPSPFSSSNATVLSLIKTLPYNVSIISVNSLLVPYGFDLMASETRPPLGLNITKALLDGHNFFVAASLLSASGVVQEFEADEGGAGITLFVPTDSAFADLSENDVSLQSLPADKKADVLKFHVLHSYYPLGSLESIVNPVQPTLATEDMGAGSFTLNISRANGSVAIDSGIVLASVTQTVFDQNPVAIFGVSKVLLPKEIFGSNPVLTSKPGNSDMGNAQPPAVALSPESSPKMLSSAPGAREEIKSGVGGSQWLSNLPFLCVVAVWRSSSLQNWWLLACFVWEFQVKALGISKAYDIYWDNSLPSVYGAIRVSSCWGDNLVPALLLVDINSREDCKIQNGF
ncbi:FASCICLIN-LIKE ARABINOGALACTAN PROTEIN 4 [Salix koriyanagi]|uniref:FASCICLIN-LIKE ARABINOGALACTAN PROTEIN 4 n=1 Tax=Salix koriyanagi TaxID=2511006 RepID=A0A9Q0ZTI1_9ROSI|nr:FASCICLIN-LIKE ARABINOGALACTAN PROTEIN 4 [Salix koriyanagi]